LRTKSRTARRRGDRHAHRAGAGDGVCRELLPQAPNGAAAFGQRHLRRVQHLPVGDRRQRCHRAPGWSNRRVRCWTGRARRGAGVAGLARAPDAAQTRDRAGVAWRTSSATQAPCQRGAPQSKRRFKPPAASPKRAPAGPSPRVGRASMRECNLQRTKQNLCIRALPERRWRHAGSKLGEQLLDIERRAELRVRVVASARPATETRS
jgi:hypothetical protein